MHEMVQVPYRGTGPVITDVMSGAKSLSGFRDYGTGPGNFIVASKLRIVAVTSPKRLASAPEVPTAVESGLPGMIVRVYWAVGAGWDAAIRGRSNFTSDRSCVGGIRRSSNC